MCIIFRIKFHFNEKKKSLTQIYTSVKIVWIYTQLGTKILLEKCV